MPDIKNLTQVETLQGVSEAEGPVGYVPHGPTGNWPVFLTAKGPTDDWDVNTLLCNLVDYVFNTLGHPMVISQLYDTPKDEVPSYKITCYDIGYQQLCAFDERTQPSWFNVVIEPSGALYNVKLTPTRSLMKLIYKTVL